MPSLLLVGRGPGGRVDDGLGSDERLVETLTADHVDTLRARDRDYIVSPLREDLDEVRSDPTRGSCDGNPLSPAFGLHRSSFLLMACEGETEEFFLDSFATRDWGFTMADDRPTRVGDLAGRVAGVGLDAAL
jgi:hypothetical protein